MKRTVLGVVGVLVVAVAGVLVWWFTSTNIDDPVVVTAPTLATATTATASDTSTETSSPDSSVADSSVTDSSVVDSGAAEGAVTFELTDASSVTFELDEVLNGSPKRVVATNTEVAAQLRVDSADLSTAELGTVVIGAQTFTTDSGNRDRAIRGPILDSNTFPTIEFVPTALEGLSGSVAPGDQLEFTVTGDLTVRDVTASATFTVSAGLVDGGTLEGTAEATVSRETYGLQIPSVASVADVSDEVLLRIEFVAASIG